MKNENTLLDLAADILKAKNDAQLCRALGVAPPVISKTRHGRLPVGASLVIKLHEVTGMAIREIKAYITHGPQLVKPSQWAVHEVHKGTMSGRAGDFQNLPKGAK